MHFWTGSCARWGPAVTRERIPQNCERNCCHISSGELRVLHEVLEIRCHTFLCPHSWGRIKLPRARTAPPTVELPLFGACGLSSSTSTAAASLVVCQGQGRYITKRTSKIRFMYVQNELRKCQGSLARHRRQVEPAPVLLFSASARVHIGPCRLAVCSHLATARAALELGT